MIPKLIHQTAKTRELPKEWQGFQKIVRELHPDWEYRLWTDEDNDAFVTTEYPDFLPIFRAFPRGIMRADVIRYLIMYRIGGLYLDLDYEMLKPFDLLEHRLVLPWNRNKAFGDAYDGIGNCIFASEPGHEFWKLVIDDLTEKPPLGPNVDVEASTGPAYLTRLFGEKVSGTVLERTMYLPTRKYFHFPAPNNQGDREKLIHEGVAYGFHHCDGTWRLNKSLWERAYVKVGRLVGIR